MLPFVLYWNSIDFTFDVASDAFPITFIVFSVTCIGLGCTRLAVGSVPSILTSVLGFVSFDMSFSLLIAWAAIVYCPS